MLPKRILQGLAAIAILVGGSLIWPAGARAQDSIRIAAVVNDDAISMFDVYERMQIVFVTANLEDTQETRQRLFPQVLRALIDERLQRQEGERQGIELSDAEIQSAAGYLEDSIGLPRGQLDSFLDYNNISREAFMEQIKTELTWTKLVQERMRPESITEEEIQETLERLKASSSEPAYLLAEIFVSVDDPSRDGEALANMERLVESLRTGADFQAIARQFSQSASSAAGGDLGWIVESQLSDDIRGALAGMTPVALSPPIRVAGGYKLILLRDKRIGFGVSAEETEVVMRQVLLPAGPEVDDSAIGERANQISQSLKVCDDFDGISEVAPDAQVSSPVSARLSELQPALVQVVANIPVGQASTPLRSEMGYHVVMVCERTDVNAGLPTRQDIRNKLDDEQFDLVARGYLRDLRRSAFIDIRL